MIKVSVIIPVFNSERYIERCIDSIINQTLKDIEVICIDDCSEDESLSILKLYEQNDSRIKVYRNEHNLGTASSRNRAIELTKGKYIQFVDADDFLSKDALENLFYDAEVKNLDMCFLKMRIQYENPEKRTDILLGIKNSYEQIFTGKKLLAEFIEKKEFFYYAWMVFYRTDFLKENHLRFKNITIGEGGDLTLRALTVAEKVFVNNEKYYNYYIHSGSVTDSNEKRRLILFGQIVQYIDMIKCMAKDTDSEEIYNFLNFQLKKISGGITNLSMNDIDDFEKKLEDKFSKHVFKALLTKLELTSYNIILQPDELKQVKQNKNVILFGAGYALRDVIDYLNKYEIEIFGIAVTEKSNNPKCLYGHHIYEISELIEFNSNSIIIVTSNIKYKAEIERILRKNGFFKYIFLDIIIG